MTATSPDLSTRAAAICQAYGPITGEHAPQPETWARIAALPAGQPVTLVNFFRMRAHAAYPAGHPDAEAGLSGQAAFDRYAAVSGGCLAAAGGRFLLVAPADIAFTGDDAPWDLVAIGTYPGPEALIALYEMPDYRDAYLDRRAACAAERVTLCLGTAP